MSFPCSLTLLPLARLNYSRSPRLPPLIFPIFLSFSAGSAETRPCHKAQGPILCSTESLGCPSKPGQSRALCFDQGQLLKFRADAAACHCPWVRQGATVQMPFASPDRGRDGQCWWQEVQSFPATAECPAGQWHPRTRSQASIELSSCTIGPPSKS